MSTRLYVGNLPYSTTPNELREMFSAHGEVTDAHVVMDRESGRSRGFGFVTMATEEQAKTAARAMNDQRVGGRPLVVNEARERGSGPPPRSAGGGGPRPPRPPRDGGGAPGPARDDRPPPSSRPPRAPRPPLVQEPMEIPSEEPRRRPRTTGRKQEHDREAPNRVRPDDEDDFSGVSNWRDFLDEQEDPKDDLNPVKEVFSGDEDEDVEDEDWRRYVDNDDDAGGTTLGDEMRGGSSSKGEDDDDEK